VTTAYLAAEDLGRQLDDELARAGVQLTRRHGRLLVSDDEPITAAWAINTWFDVEEIPVSSIGEAAKALKARQRNWAVYAPLHRGRAELIADKLPHVSAKPLEFGALAPTAPLGSWTLVQPDLVLAAPHCTSPFPNGEVPLVEDREGPPSRAYLKLWEAFVHLGRWPQAGEHCLDLGASPGGWTWVLARCGANVIAVDKAPLEPSIAAMRGVSWREESAFGLEPKDFERVDWLCCDIIGYPNRLLAMVNRWRASGRVRNIVLTVKFQGHTDHEATQAFAEIPGAQLFHLHQNKHELTFALLDIEA
jgi:23S rRNA (cytidine2498-2'-O)-methyltransferase